MNQDINLRKHIEGLLEYLESGNRVPVEKARISADKAEFIDARAALSASASVLCSAAVVLQDLVDTLTSLRPSPFGDAPQTQILKASDKAVTQARLYLKTGYLSEAEAFPGHPVALALRITKLYPDLGSASASQGGALTNPDIRGAGGNVRHALELLEALKKFGETENHKCLYQAVFDNAEAYFQRCANEGHRLDRERVAAAAKENELELRERLLVWG